MKKLMIAFILICVIPTFLHAEIYKCTDENGETHFSAKPGPGCTLLPGSIHETDNKKSSDVPAAEAEDYKNTQGYKDYLKLPDKFKSTAAEELYKKGYEAEQKVKRLPSSKGGTVDQFLDNKANVPAVEDLGWTTRPYQGGFKVERVLLLGKMKLIYRWSVDSNGTVKAVNGKAIGITK